MVLGACNTTSGETRCRTNLDCGAYKTCSVDTGACLCVDNRACGAGEFCNGKSLCQTVAGCQDNSDCELQSGGQRLICDVKAGLCQSADQCFDDSHCALGRICDPSTTACVEGCRDEADCVPGQGCIRETNDQVLGRCSVGTCSVTEQCPVGHNCDLTTHTCVFDARGPFCGACTRFSPTDPQCGERDNYCLVDTGDPARGSHYCGVDCTQEQGCPNGYECKPVIIFGPPATPSCLVEECENGVCSRTGRSCSVSMDCPQGLPRGDCRRAIVGVCANNTATDCMSDAECGGSVGSCRFSECRVRERAAYGVCTCLVDSDCPSDDCRDVDLSDPDNPVVGHCFLSGHRCYDDEDCNTITCSGGGCLIGQNCKPGAERRCIDLMGSPNAQ